MIVPAWLQIQAINPPTGEQCIMPMAVEQELGGLGSLAMRLFAQVSLAGRWDESSDPPQRVRTMSFPLRPSVQEAPDSRFSSLPAPGVLGKKCRAVRTPKLQPQMVGLRLRSDSRAGGNLCGGFHVLI